MAEVKKEAMLGNSHKQREAAAEAEKKALPAKKQVKSESVLEKEAHGIAGFLVQEVVVPSLKEMAYSIAEETGKAILKTIKTAIFGAGGSPKRRSSSGGYVSYQEYYRRKQDDDPFYSDNELRERNRSHSARKAGRFASEKFGSRGEADMVLDTLVETLEQYGMATVSDFYEYAGRPEHSRWTDNDWGWTSLSSAEVRQSPGGWYVRLPEPRPLPRN